MKVSKLLPFLQCPRCKNEFTSKDLEILSELEDEIFGLLFCHKCKSGYPITYNIVNLLTEFERNDPAIQEMDRFVETKDINKDHLFRKIRFISNHKNITDAKTNWDHYYDALQKEISKHMKKSLIDTSKSSLFHFIHQFVQKYGSNGKKIFEVGIGTGAFSLNLALKGYDVYGLDYSYSALKVLTKLALDKGLINKIGVVRADFNKLPFKPIFSHVLSLGFIEHFKDPAKTVSEHRKLCKENGYLFVDVPNSSGIWMKFYALKRMIEQRNGQWKLGLERSFSTKALTKFLTDAGFEIIEDFCADFRLAIGSAFSLKAVSPVEKLMKVILYSFFMVTKHLSKFFPSKKPYKYGFFAIVIGRKQNR